MLQTWMRRESDLVQALAQAYAEREVLESSIRAAAEVKHCWSSFSCLGCEPVLLLLRHLIALRLCERQKEASCPS